MAGEPDMKCAEALDNLVAYVQEELDDAEIMRGIEAHMAECEVCRREEAEVRKTFQMVREAYHEFVPSDRVWKALIERLHSLRDRIAAGAAVEEGERYGLSEAPAPSRAEARSEAAVPKKRRAMAVLISVAAVLVLVVGVVIVLKLTSFRLVLEKGNGVTVLASEGGGRAVGPGQAIEKGWGVKTAESPALLKYGDGSTLEMSANTELKVVDDREIRLESGMLTADIKPSSKGFTVATKFGDVRAEGTRFSVEVSREALVTIVRVFEGRVIFVNADGRTVVEKGQWSRATVNAAPAPAVPVGAVAGQSEISRDTVSVRISVFDGQNFDAGDGGIRPVDVEADKPLVVRFEVKNVSDKEMLIPTGRTKGLLILLGIQGYWSLSQDVTAVGEMVSDEPRTSDEDKVVRVLPGEAYRFDYRIPVGVTKFEKGRGYKIYGTYCFVGSQGIKIGIK